MVAHLLAAKDYSGRLLPGATHFHGELPSDVSQSTQTLFLRNISCGITALQLSWMENVFWIQPSESRMILMKSIAYRPTTNQRTPHRTMTITNLGSTMAEYELVRLAYQPLAA